MRKLTLILTLMTTLLIISGCGASGQGVGNYLGIPGFIIDPLLYANVEIDGDAEYLDLRKLYIVSFVDSAGNPLDNSLWIFFVQEDETMENITAGDTSPSVILKINDVGAVSQNSYSVNENLASTNFMVWLDAGDGKSQFIGDSIELDIDKISNVAGATIEGEFDSTLSRGSSIAAVVNFKFKGEVGTIEAPVPTI